MARRIVIGALVGGIIVFVMGAITHMATPLGTAGFSVFPSDREEAVLAAMKTASPSSGMYLFPGMNLGGSMSETEEKAWEARIKAGPTGLLVIRPNGAEPMSPGQLLTELASNIAGALVVAILLAMTRPGLGYLGRVLFVTLVGLAGWISIVISYWNWYAFSDAFTWAAGIVEVVSWAAAGLAMAFVVRPSESKPVGVAPTGAASV